MAFMAGLTLYSGSPVNSIFTLPQRQLPLMDILAFVGATGDHEANAFFEARSVVGVTDGGQGIFMSASQRCIRRSRQPLFPAHCA